MTIRQAQDEDSGQYQCFVENQYGIATSNSVFLRKAQQDHSPNVTSKTVFAKLGDPFQIKCPLPLGLPKPRVSWLFQKVNGSIETIDDPRITYDTEGNLWFSNVTLNDASTYACVNKRNYYGEAYTVRHRVNLNVVEVDGRSTQKSHAVIRQYVTPQYLLANRADNVELFCIYGGTPLPKTVWTRNGGPLRGTDFENNYGKSLLFYYVDVQDAGVFTCHTTNEKGYTQSHSIKLDVHSKPYFTIEPQVQDVVINDTAVFLCEVNGVPEPVISWIHNGKPISEAAPNERRTIGNNSIVIREVTGTDIGNYGCNATNSLGYAYKDVYLNVVASMPSEMTDSSDLDIFFVSRGFRIGLILIFICFIAVSLFRFP